MQKLITKYIWFIAALALTVLCQYEESVKFISVYNYTSMAELHEIKEKNFVQCNNSENVFHCDEENCIIKNDVCNGIPDCQNGEDELVRECGCLLNEFPCTNICINMLKRCDRVIDCEDEEDEKNCEVHTCSTTHFKCSNHYCIPREMYCDFQDNCGDNSDELNCDHRECYYLEFTCKNGQCIPPRYLCDGREDCLDASDELECSQDYFVECGDGSQIHKYFWCDGWPDCSDSHADELNCGPCEREDEFQCLNGRCIRRANVCDAHCDCVSTFADVNGTNSMCEDEQDCEDFYTVENGVKMCKVGVSLNCFAPNDIDRRKNERCIREEYICDGYNDCKNSAEGLDEYGCNTTDDIQNEPFFLCNDGRLLPTKRRCDYKIDCLAGEDEANCESAAFCEASKQPVCLNGECLHEEYKCDRIFQCLDKSDEMNCHDNTCPRGWVRCRDGGQCLPRYQWCDFWEDCLDGSDEIYCNIRECTPNEFQCRNGQCINASEMCIDNGQRSGCADGSHLLNCGDVKCVDGFFKCRNGPCISQTLICNKIADCKGTWDDEKNCTQQCAESNPPCKCHDIHMDCTNLSLKSFPQEIEKQINQFYMSGNLLYNLTNQTFIDLSRVLFLDLSNNSITKLTSYIFQPLWRLGTLNLQNNRISVLENSTFFGLSSLTGLHLQSNSIQILRTMSFYGLSSLTTLDLRQQQLWIIEKEAFLGLRSLTYLDLSRNMITHLEDGTFIGMPKLLYLDVSYNHLRSIEQNVFRVTIGLQQLKTDEFRFCCLARHVASCLPRPNEFSSCEDLMTNLVLRICVWALGIIATFANLLVLVFRSVHKNSNRVHSFLIKNLALGDFLMGTYLLIIAFVDWHYRGIYFIHDSEWRSSGMCNFAGFISTFSSELTVFTLTVITLDRLLVILFPFRTHRLEINRTRYLILAGWTMAAGISVIPLPFLKIDYFRNFYGRSGVCLPLHITPDKPNGWEYSVFVFLFLNFLSFTIIVVSYLWMYLAARDTHRAVHRDHHSSESTMAFRMTLLVATDAACWIPIILLGFWSLAGFTVPSQVPKYYLF